MDRIHPLPAIPLKVLAHDDLIGRLIGVLSMQCFEVCQCVKLTFGYEQAREAIL